MKTPDFPKNEHARLESLKSLKVLDTVPEERFDRLTRMAKRLFKVPIALVSLVDENRQWFKSCVGLSVRETPRDISFCGHSILGDSVFIIPNATEDARFADNPLVVDEPHIRFYAGYPLSAPDGSKLGTLCIIDREPRSFSPEDIDMLEDLAVMAEHELAALQMATMDELTEISNRRGFMMLARHSLSFCIREKVTASLIFIDLDKFKLINDSLGHEEGDYALLTFAKLMQQAFRDSDIIARLGGDEFAVLLTHTNKQQAQTVVARFHQRLIQYNCRENRGYDLEFSYGTVELEPERHDSVEALLADGDSLMYEFKRAKCGEQVNLKQG